ncbi:E3 RID-beta [Baboon adenovirus 3]|uniref:E3 RID-beta n=1 Tax=Simian mastadenovirus C TaxID=1962300 RepID=M9YZ20_9ADEN|nr:E3 RID-beta [Baboon adenovirus 3]AGK27149.1 E3 RID-beta [Baboon adenovirus 3]AGK27221.1 E3 RID-beta [Simian mastadenovirus C]
MFSMIPLLVILCDLLPFTYCHCPLNKPWSLYTCYAELPDIPVIWLYVATAALVFVATCVGVKIYFCLKIGWLHPPEDLPRFPLVNAFQMQPPPPDLIRAPSVVSYFQLAGGDD